MSETLGNYPFEEHIIETLNDARAPLPEAERRHHPARIEQLVAPVVSERMHAELSAWDDTGFDLTAAKTMSLNNIYVRSLAPKELLQGGRARSLGRGRFCGENRPTAKAMRAGELARRDRLRLCDVVDSGAGARRHAVDRAGCRAHALGATLFPAAVAARGQGRRNGRASTCARARRMEAAPTSRGRQRCATARAARWRARP